MLDKNLYYLIHLANCFDNNNYDTHTIDDVINNYPVYKDIIRSSSLMTLAKEIHAADNSKKELQVLNKAINKLFKLLSATYDFSDDILKSVNDAVKELSSGSSIPIMKPVFNIVRNAINLRDLQDNLKNFKKSNEQFVVKQIERQKQKNQEFVEKKRDKKFTSMGDINALTLNLFNNLKEVASRLRNNILKNKKMPDKEKKFLKNLFRYIGDLGSNVVELRKSSKNKDFPISSVIKKMMAGSKTLSLVMNRFLDAYVKTVGPDISQNLKHLIENLLVFWTKLEQQYFAITKKYKQYDLPDLKELLIRLNKLNTLFETKIPSKKKISQYRIDQRIIRLNVLANRNLTSKITKAINLIIEKLEDEFDERKQMLTILDIEDAIQSIYPKLKSISYRLEEFIVILQNINAIDLNAYVNQIQKLEKPVAGSDTLLSKAAPLLEHQEKYVPATLVSSQRVRNAIRSVGQYIIKINLAIKKYKDNLKKGAI